MGSPNEALWMGLAGATAVSVADYFYGASGAVPTSAGAEFLVSYTASCPRFSHRNIVTPILDQF
jgi:hypothetical protein